MSTMSYAGHPSTASLDFLVFDVYRSYIEEHVNLLQVAELMPCMKEVLSEMRKVETSAQAAQIFLNNLKQYNETEKYKELAEALLQTEYEVLYCALDCGPVCFGPSEHKKVMSLFSRRVEETFSPSEVAEQLACRGVLAIENFQAIKSLEENGNLVDAIFLLFDSLARQNENWYEHLLDMADCCEYSKLVNELDPTYYEQKGKTAQPYQDKGPPGTPGSPKVYFPQDDRLVNMKSYSDVGTVSDTKVQPSTISGWKTPKYGPGTPDIRPNSALADSRKGTSYMGMESNVQSDAMYMDQQVGSTSQTPLLYTDQCLDGRNAVTTDSRATTMYSEQAIDRRTPVPTESRAASMYPDQCEDGRTTGGAVSRVTSMYPEQGMDGRNTGAPVSRTVSMYPEQGMDGRNTGAPVSRTVSMYPDQGMDVRNTGAPVSRVASAYPDQCVDGRSTGGPVSRVASAYPEQGMDGRNTGAPVSRTVSMYPDQGMDGRNTGAPVSRTVSMYPDQGMDVRNTGAAVSRVASMYSDQCVDGRSTGGPVSRVASAYPEQGMDGRNTGAPVSRAVSMHPDQSMDGRNTGAAVSRVASMYPDQCVDGRSTGGPVSRVASAYPEQGMDGRNTAPVSRVASMYPDQGASVRNTGAPVSRVASMYPEQGMDGRNTGAPVSRVASMYPDQCIDGRNTGAPVSRVASMYPDQGVDARNTGGGVSRVASMYPDQGVDGRSSAPVSSRPPSTFPEQGMDSRTHVAAGSRAASQYQVQGSDGRASAMRDSRSSARESRANVPFSEQGIDCARIAQECRASGMYTEQIMDCTTLAEMPASSEVGAMSVSRVGSAAPERRLTSKSTDSIRGQSRSETFERPQSRVSAEEPIGKKSYTEAQNSAANIARSQGGSVNQSRQALVRVASYSPTSRPASAGATLPSEAHKVSVTCQGRPQQADGGCKYCVGNLPCSLCNNKVRNMDAGQAGGGRPSSFTPQDPRYSEQHHRHQDQAVDRRNTNAPVVLDSQLGCVRQQLTELTNLMLKQMSLLGNVNGKVDRLEVNIRRLLEHHH